MDVTLFTRQKFKEEGDAHAGDCIVQRGINHTWVNRSGKPYLLAAALTNVEPAP